MTTYLDMAATTPVHPTVAETVMRIMTEEFGNAGSRTHEFGARAKKTVESARRVLARTLDAEPRDVVFCSGATEANNLALLGLEFHARSQGRLHIVSTAIEHKAVLEPLAELEKRGFDVDLIRPGSDGRVAPDDVLNAVRDDTALVSVMHVNNETGVVQPIVDIGRALAESGVPALLHVDAAQSFGRRNEELLHARPDMVSLSGHKLGAPKGVGALVLRRRGFDAPKLRPLLFGGGQERGLRPGTQPVALIAGLARAAELAEAAPEWAAGCLKVRTELLEALAPLAPVLHGDQAHVAPHILNFAIPGVNSEAALVALRGLAAVSNGSACTSARYAPSHVLTAMGLPSQSVSGALRFSWGPETNVEYSAVAEALGALRA